MARDGIEKILVVRKNWNNSIWEGTEKIRGVMELKKIRAVMEQNLTGIFGKGHELLRKGLVENWSKNE